MTALCSDLMFLNWALLAFLFACEALAALYTPCMQCDFLPLV